MNAPLIHPLADPAAPFDLACAAIGRLIVAAAGFEDKLTRLLKALEPAASPKLLPSQKIAAIRAAIDAQACDPFGSKQQRRVKVILIEAERLLALRHECAHSSISPVIVDGEQQWLLRNAQSAGDPLDRCVLVSKAQMVTTTSRLKQLTHQLGQILNPPLPPQPKPDAAAGP